MDQDKPDTFLRYETEGRTIEVPVDRLSILGFGRSSTNQIHLRDSMASREHAMLRRNATGHCILNDLGSTNGTRLNGRRITTPTEVKDGDVIYIGQHQITFVQAELPTLATELATSHTQYLVEKQLVSVLVADMRNYTGISEAMGPERTGEMMGDIFREVGELLKQTNCWSTKFIGDAVMALWVHGDNALSRVDIVNAFDVISEYQGIFRVAERKFDPPEPLRFGCGINAGMASTGNIGMAGAADFTAMGETVNVAFALETSTKLLGYDVLIARGVFARMSDIAFEPKGMIDLDLKGRTKPVTALPLKFDEIGDLIGTLLAA